MSGDIYWCGWSGMKKQEIMKSECIEIEMIMNIRLYYKKESKYKGSEVKD
jgi:hypothetical protein